MRRFDWWALKSGEVWLDSERSILPIIYDPLIEINKEPLQLEYEGADTYTYTITIQFDTKVDWHVAIASAVVPYYFVVNQWKTSIRLHRNFHVIFT